MRLSQAKHALLEKYVRRHAMRKPDGRATIPARPANAPVPLSFAQQQVWLHSQMAGDTPIYNEAITIYRLGPLDLKALERCMVEILRRHEIWRTTFDVIDGNPIQVVQSAPDRFPLEITDLRHVPESERDTEARRLAAGECAKALRPEEGATPERHPCSIR